MKHKVIVAMSLVVAGVMTYLCSQDWTKDSIIFLGSYLQDLE